MTTMKVFQDQVNTYKPISPNSTFLTAVKDLLCEQMVLSCLRKMSEHVPDGSRCLSVLQGHCGKTVFFFFFLKIHEVVTTRETVLTAPA